MLCGIRHNKVYENLDKLFKKLSEIAELVFYDGLYQLLIRETNGESINRISGLGTVQRTLTVTFQIFFLTVFFQIFFGRYFL